MQSIIIDCVTRATRAILKAFKDGQAVTTDNMHDINDQLSEIRGELIAIRETMSK